MKIKFFYKQFFVPNFAKRLAFMLPAVVLMGVFLSVLIEIGWGTDPASFMNLNISHAIGLSLGTTQVMVYAIMLVFTILFGADKIGFGTLANMFFIGYIADFCRWLWTKTGFRQFIQESGCAVTCAVFAAALCLFVIVASVYMNAQMGVAPYDAIPAIISGVLPKVPYFAVRIVFDFSAVGIGILAGRFSKDGLQGSVIGSVAMSVLLGPAVQLAGKPLKKILSSA